MPAVPFTEHLLPARHRAGALPKDPCHPVRRCNRGPRPLTGAGRGAEPSSEAEVPGRPHSLPKSRQSNSNRGSGTPMASVSDSLPMSGGRWPGARGPGRGGGPTRELCSPARLPTRATSQAQPARCQPEAPSFFLFLWEGGVRGACRAQCPHAPPSRLRGSRHLDPRRALVGSKEQPRPLGPFRRPRPPAGWPLSHRFHRSRLRFPAPSPSPVINIGDGSAGGEGAQRGPGGPPLAGLPISFRLLSSGLAWGAPRAPPNPPVPTLPGAGPPVGLGPARHPSLSLAPAGEPWARGCGLLFCCQTPWPARPQALHSPPLAGPPPGLRPHPSSP